MTNHGKIVLGIRDSKLSRAQTNEFIELASNNIEGMSRNSFEIRHIKTTGDVKNSERLDQIGGKGLFIKEIEEHILSGDVDLGIHSMKDMPYETHEDLEVICFLPRFDSSDVLISNSGKTLKNLKTGSVVGTSSIRRRAQILSYRKDLSIKLLRGNVDTRIKKLENNDYDAIILAYAGLKRLNLIDKVTEVLDQVNFMSPAGQGTVGIQSKKKRAFRERFEKINNQSSEITNISERFFLKTIKANCNSPVSVVAKLNGQVISIDCRILSHDGDLLFSKTLTGDKNEAQNLGKKLGDLAVSQLGQNIIENLDQLQNDFNYKAK